ncbi:MAG: DUF2206 domain-containing protein [Candidatus Baldrarchaeia archaeon]
MHVKLGSRNFLLLILFLQFTVYVIVLFNVSVARQVIGFVYFTFVPGYVIVKLLKLEEFNWIEIILFSVGFSIAFLMFAGLLINELCFLIGFLQPLSLMPLLVILNSLILIGGVLVYRRSESVELHNSNSFHFPLFALLYVCLPILSIIGAVWINAYNGNILLLITILAISLLFIIGILIEKLLPSKLYPLAIIMIAITLLYHNSLISNYTIAFGSDVPIELYVFKTTQNSAYWNSTNPFFGDIQYGSLQSMLSITILPSIYSSLLNLDSTWTFKIIFPLIFSFVPLALYQLWKRFIGEKRAFLSTFLFMAYGTFYNEMLGLNRQIIAELFFVLLLLLVLNKKMKMSSKIICFIVFSFGLVTSHYGLSAIFLFFIFLSFVLLFVVNQPSKNITANMVILFSVVMFVWYIYTSSSATFNTFLEWGNHIYSQLGEFFNPASRGQEVLKGLGLEAPPTIWNMFSRAFAYVTEFLIVVGFFGIITKRASVRVKRDYFTLSLIAMAFLAALILVPGLANTMNMSRFYHVLLFFLAPLCALGAEVLVRFLSKRKAHIFTAILLLCVLIPYFLFQTGFVYEVTGSESWSIPLSKYRMDPLRLYGSFGYIDAYSAPGAQWLSKNVDVVNSQLYADGASRNYVLTAYGMIYRGYVNGLSNTTKVAGDGVVYLSTLNVVYGKIVYGRVWNTSELSFVFKDLNAVYSNGGSEVYENTP